MGHGVMASKEFLTKLNTTSPNNPAIARLDVYPTEFKTYVHTKSFTQTSHSSFIHDQPKLEAIKMNERTAVRPDDGVSFDNKKK